MTVTLEFWGARGPWRDPERFVNAYRALHPNTTDADMVTMVHRENARRRPRHELKPFLVFGADILSDDLHSMDAWQYLPKTWKRDLPLYPVAGGKLIQSGDAMADVRLKAAIDTAGTRNINRASLLVPRGLSKTYVWCKANNWLQDVEDADVAIIRNTPGLRDMFADPNRVGPFRVGKYDYLSTGSTGISSLQDAQAFERDHTRKPLWKGR